jgi:hypothetical protein
MHPGYLRLLMGRAARDGSGLVLVVGSMGLLYAGITQLRMHDYLASMLLLGTGLSVLRAGVELLRPTLGE